MQKETRKMTSNLQIGKLRRAAGLSIALVACGAPAALADPPGYYFQELAQPGPSQPEMARGTTAPIKRNPSDPPKATLGKNDRSISPLVHCQLDPGSTSAE